MGFKGDTGHIMVLNIVILLCILPSYVYGQSAALNGTIVQELGVNSEYDISLSNLSTVTFELTGTTFVPTAGDNNAITTAIIAGCTSNKAGAGGWNAKVKTTLTHSDVTRTSATELLIEIPLIADYYITENENITCTLPATATVAATPIVASGVLSMLDAKGVAKTGGTLRLGNQTEAQIRTGGGTIEVEFTSGDRWHSTIGANNNITLLLINSIGTNIIPAEVKGYNALVRTQLTHTHVNRVSDKLVRITLPATPGYSIVGSQETIRVDIPRNCTEGASEDLFASPSLPIHQLPRADLIGNLVGGVPENLLTVPGSRIIIQLFSEQWQPTVADEQNANLTQLMSNGIVSSGMSSNGWNKIVSPSISPGNYERTSDSVLTLRLPTGYTSYAITQNETITVTVNPALLVGTSQLVASPQILIYDIPGKVTLGGTFFAKTSVLESQLVAGGLTITFTLEHATFKWGLGSNSSDTDRLLQSVQVIGSSHEALGWKNYAAKQITFAHVSNTSRLVTTITLPPLPSYLITKDESMSFLLHADTNDESRTMTPKPVSTILILNEGPPDPPQPRIVRTTALSINITWDKPNDNAVAITGYEVLMDDGNGGSLVEVSSGTKLYYYVAALLPATTYRLTVRAINALGPSVSNVLLPVTTLSKKSRVFDFIPARVFIDEQTTITLKGELLGDTSAQLTDIKVGGVSCKSTLVWLSVSEVKCTVGPFPKAQDVKAVVTTLDLGEGPESEAVLKAIDPYPFVGNVAPTEVWSDPLRAQVVVLTGSHLGTSPADVELVTVNGHKCHKFTWISSRRIDCSILGVKAVGAGYAQVTTKSLGKGVFGDTLVTFKPLRPTIESVTPLQGWTTRGVMVTITGEYLGWNTTDLLQVTVAGIQCKLVPGQSWQSRTKLTCLAGPSVSVMSGPLQVTTHSGGTGSLGSQTFVFSPPAPTITSVTPAFAWSGVPTVIKISGFFLGESKKDIQRIYVLGRDCVDQAFWTSENEIGCRLPVFNTVTKGQVQVWTYSRGAGPFAPLLFEIRTPVPVVEAINPLRGPSTGGTSITLKGVYLGNSRSDIQDITINGASCVSSKVWYSESSIGCTTPRHQGTGPIQVTTRSRGQGPESLLKFFFVPTSDVDIFSVTPDISRPEGGQQLTITGRGLGDRKEDILEIWIGNQTCTVSKFWRSNQVIGCRIPPNAPGYAPVRVKVLSHRNERQALSPVEFAYVPRGFSRPHPKISVIHPFIGPSEGGTDVVLSGVNLGQNWFDVRSITLAGVACRDISYHDSKTIGCTSAPARPGTTGPVVVTSRSGGVSPSFGNYTYVYPKPEVVGVKPKTLPLSGGRITVRGLHFGNATTSKARILVGVVEASNVTLVSETEAVGTLPPQTVANTNQLYGVAAIVDGVAGGFNTKLFVNYLPDKDLCPTPCDWNSFCTNNTCACMAGWAQAPACDKPLIEFTPTPELYTSEEGHDVNITVVLHERPKTDVAILVSSTDLSSGVPDPKSLRFTRDNYATPQTIRIVPQQDSFRDGNSTYFVRLRASSLDRRFTKVSLDDIQLMAVDSLAHVTTISPSILKMEGGKVTITAYNLDPQIYVYFNGDTPLELESGRTIELSAEARRRLRTLQQQQTQVPSQTSTQQSQVTGTPPQQLKVKETFQVTIPSSAQEGYNTIWVVNGNGDIGVYPNVYMTDQCPIEGKLQVDGKCKDCPEGGICPGGDRIWPKYGYWNADEFSGYVRECDPRERCLGGRVPQCADTYEGPFCGACVKEHYKAFGNCLKCPSIIEGAIRLATVYGIWTLFAFLALWPDNPLVLTYGAVAMNAMQMVRAIGSMGSIHMPEWVKRAYLGLQMFSADINALLPECFYSSNQGQTFAYALIFQATLAIPLLGGGYIGWMLLTRSSRYITPTQMETAQVRYKDRFFRALTVYLTLMYLSCTTLVISTIACFRESSVGRWYMMTDPAVRCYRPLQHMLMSLASVIIFLGFILGFPGYISWTLWKYKEEMGNSKRFQLRFGFFFDYYKHTRWQRFWFLLDMVAMFVVANYGSSLRPHPRYSMIFGGIWFFLHGTALVVFRPFKEWFMAFCRTIFILSYLLIMAMNYYLTTLVLEDETNNVAAAAANAKIRDTIGRATSALFLVVLFMMTLTLLSIAILMMFFIFAPSRVPRGVLTEFKVDSSDDESYFSDFESTVENESSEESEEGALTKVLSTGISMIWKDDPAEGLLKKTESAKSTDALLGDTLESISDPTIAMYVKSLERMPILEPLSVADKILLAKAMKPVGYMDGEEVITQGTRGDEFYIILRGLVKVVVYSPSDLKKSKKKNGKEVAILKKGDYFGEQALVTDNPRGASCIAVGHVKCITLSRDDFVYHMGPVLPLLKEKLLERQEAGQNQKALERSEAQVKMYLKFLSKVPILEPLTRAERVELAKGLEPVTFHNEQVIIQQGDIGDTFYIIERGAAKVYIKGPKHKGKHMGDEVAELHRGRYFGEQALLTDNPRAASVIAFGKCKCIAINRELFRQLLGPVEDLLKNEILDRDKSSRSRNTRLYQRFLNQVPLFNTLTRDEKAELATGMEPESYFDGEYIISQGELGDALYIIEKGMCRVTIQKKPGKSGRKKAKEVAVLERGDFFGEKALITDNPRGANVIAYGDCKCAVISRSTFVRLLGPVEDVLREAIKDRDAGKATSTVAGGTVNAIADLYLSFLSKIPLLEPLTMEERVELSRNMTPLNFTDGEVIIHQGDIGDEFYIIEDGEVRVNVQEKAGKGKGKDVAVLKKGDFFGEQALITDNPRSANVISQGFCNVAVVDRATFTRVLGPIEQVLKENIRKRDLTSESYESVYADSD